MLNNNNNNHGNNRRNGRNRKYRKDKKRKQSTPSYQQQSNDSDSSLEILQQQTELRRSSRIKAKTSTNNNMEISDYDFEDEETDKENDLQNREFDVTKLYVKQWKTTTNSEFNHRITINSTKKDMLKILKKHNISLPDVIHDYNTWAQSNFEGVPKMRRNPTKQQILNLFHLCICPVDVQRDPEIPCDKCDAYYHHACIDNCQDHYICENCLKDK